MSTDSDNIVSQIGAAASRKPQRQRRPEPFLRLADPLDNDGFSTLDVVNGLHGVCAALDRYLATDSDINPCADLSMAAKVLSSILQNRVLA